MDSGSDDKRVLVLAPMESVEASKPEHEVVFLLNFTDELRRRVPAGKWADIRRSPLGYIAGQSERPMPE